MPKLLFLSHIHEEMELAKIIKLEIENEFSGFVDVFVSSDGTSIPAGSNFLKRIEDGLISCVGALYLISPISIKRNWVNFELGAVWIRNSLSIKNNQPEIPTIPICHSGISPSTLPAPVNNLNAIIGNQSAQLEFAFKSIQSAVGGKGALKTDFDNLSNKIVAFEKQYTLGENVLKLLLMLHFQKAQTAQLITHCAQYGKGTKTILQLGFLQTSDISNIMAIEQNELCGLIKVTTTNPGTNFYPTGAVNGAQVSMEIVVDIVNDFKTMIQSRI
jgi:hypothetical protein